MGLHIAKIFVANIFAIKFASLVHTHGHELFYGVIHPPAGLFEDYFDVDKAAEEHKRKTPTGIEAIKYLHHQWQEGCH